MVLSSECAIATAAFVLPSLSAAHSPSSTIWASSLLLFAWFPAVFLCILKYYRIENCQLFNVHQECCSFFFYYDEWKMIYLLITFASCVAWSSVSSRSCDFGSTLSLPDTCSHSSTTGGTAFCPFDFLPLVSALGLTSLQVTTASVTKGSGTGLSSWLFSYSCSPSSATALTVATFGPL